MEGKGSQPDRDAAGKEPLEQELDQAQRLVEEMQLHQEKLKTQREELIRAQEETEISHRRYKLLYDNAPVGYLTLDREGVIHEANHAAELLLGTSRRALAGRHFESLIEPGSQDRFYFHRRMVARTHSQQAVELALRRQDGSRIFVLCESAPVPPGHSGEDEYLWVVLSDLTEQKRTEEALRQSLEQKDVLLREVYHRVKNNLQVVDGFLYLKLRPHEFPEMANTFREIQNFVRAIGMVHEKLYNSQNLSRIDFSEYVADACRSILASYGPERQERIAFRFELEEVYLDIHLAIPCGLVLNELVANAMRHAFPEGREGTISFGLHRLEDGRLELSVQDDGVGLPERFSLEGSSPAGVGLEIVKGMVKSQLQGDIEVQRGHGTTFRVRFPAQES